MEIRGLYNSRVSFVCRSCIRTIALAVLAASVFLIQSNASATIVPLGEAGQFTMLALGGSVDDSGPQGPDADPWTVDGKVGVVTSGQNFQASGSVTYNGPIYLHNGVGFNSSAPGVPQPMRSQQIDTLLEQARLDAIAASNFALNLTPTGTFGTISQTMAINENSVGNYVFNIGAINFSGNSTLTLSAPAGSNFVLNISQGVALTGGSILVAGGLNAADVLINYTGTSEFRFSGGGNTSRVYGTILAPNATVGLHPGFVLGRVIANSITMSSGANIIMPVPEVTPSSVIFGFVGLVVAFSSRRAMAAKVRAVARNGKRG
jgi:choice-of-anchor A domain-containing protein